MVQMQSYLKVADNTGAKEIMLSLYTHLTLPTTPYV